MLGWLGRLYDRPTEWGIRFERWLRLRVGWRNALLLTVAPWLAIGWAWLLGWLDTSGRLQGLAWEAPVGMALVGLFTYVAIVAAGLPNTRDDTGYGDRRQAYAIRERRVRLAALTVGVLAAAAGLLVRSLISANPVR